MTAAERKARFLDRFQAVGCPVCRCTMELRRSTWQNAERKMETLDAFQAQHDTCLKMGVPPVRPMRLEDRAVSPKERVEKYWTLGMKQHFGVISVGFAGNRSAA